MKYDELLSEHAKQLRKALTRLESSARKVADLDTKIEALSDADLEAWESFLSRFARVSDLFLAKYLRTFVLREDPGFRGSMRDFVDQAEKLGLVDDAEPWLAIRELRNLIAHEYLDQRLEDLFAAARGEAPRLLGLRDRMGGLGETR